MVLSEEERRQRRNEYMKEYRENNKEKIKEYLENNKEKIKEQRKECYEKNKEYHKVYQENNKKKIKEYQKAYNQSDAGKKSMRITKWRKREVECEDFESLYEFYINCKECEECGIELTEDKRITATTRCLDHCHKTNKFRNVLCHSCNTKRR